MLTLKDHLHHLSDHRVLIPLLMAALVVLQLCCGGTDDDESHRTTHPDRGDPWVEIETPDVP